MKNFLKKLSQKRWALGLGVLVFAAVIALLPNFALAGIGDLVTEGIGKLALLIVNLLGSLVLLPLINLVVWILSYNSFLDNQAVIVGWPLVRDLCNMFFVVILLFIAFGTILNISNYSYKSTFFKLILMAVLINFSKTIMGLAIDFAQVIMLTFVNSFRDAAAVNLIHAFGIRDMLKLEVGNENFTNWEVVGKVILAVILLVVAIGLMLAYAAVLLWRIISLWVLIILSPLAFLLSAVPAGQKYASEIWTKFTEQLTTGVILAFFMWLSFTVLAAGYSVDQKTTSGSLILSKDQGAAATGNAVQRGSVGGQANISSDIEWERLYTFIIAVALLLLALQYAQKAGGFAGSFAGKVSGKLSQIGVGAAKVIGSPAIGAYKLAGWGVKSVPNKLDQLFMKAQKGLGIKRQNRISFRPKVWKAAVERYSKERETQWYTGTAEGMTDRMLRMFTGRRSKYAEQAYDARTHEKEKEIGAAGELQEQLRAYLKKDHLEKYEGTNRRGKKVTKYKVKSGHENEVEAILAMMTKNHDLNELFKDKDIGAAYDNKFNAIGVRNMIRDLFVDQGEEEAARVGKDLSMIAFENKDAHLYGTGTVDVDKDEFIFFQEATRDEDGDEDILRTSGALVDGKTDEEKLANIKAIRQKAIAPKASLEDQNKYQDLLDDNWSANQGDLATAFILKIAGRAGLQNMTAQMLVEEAVKRYEQDQFYNKDVVDKDGKAHKKGELKHKKGKAIVDESGETSRSFLSSRLSRTGKGMLKSKAADMAKEYHHMKDETKKYGIEPALDAILQFVESNETDDVEKNRILTLIQEVTPELKGLNIKNPKIIEAIKTGDEGFMKPIREAVIRRSQEARMAAHGDVRHAEQDKNGNWQLGRYSVYADNNKPMLSGSELEGAPTPESAPASDATSQVRPAPSPEQLKIRRKRKKLDLDRQNLNNKKSQMAPESVTQEEGRIETEEKVLNQVESSQQFLERIAQLSAAINKLATEVGGPAQDEKTRLLAEKGGLEKQVAVSVSNSLVNNVLGGNPGLYNDPNWMKHSNTRSMFLESLNSQLKQVKDLDVRLYKVIMEQLQKDFTNLGDRFGHLDKDSAFSQQEKSKFLEDLK